MLINIKWIEFCTCLFKNFRDTISLNLSLTFNLNFIANIEVIKEIIHYIIWIYLYIVKSIALKTLLNSHMGTLIGLIKLHKAI